MKKLFIILLGIVALSALRASADDDGYIPMLKDGAYWISIRYMPLCDDDMCLTRTEVCGDMVVDGVTVKSMKTTEIYLDGEVRTNYFTAYEKDRAVYHGVPGNSDKLMDFNYNNKLMDFNYNIGDKTSNGYEVLDVDYTYDNRKRLTFLRDGVKHYWVEGIGSDTDQIWELTREVPTTIMYNVFLVRNEDGDCFDKDRFAEEGKRESGINQTSAGPKDDKIYNLDGIEIGLPREGEIIISNGKKFIKR